MACPKWVNYTVCEFYVNKAIFKERLKKQVGWTGVGVQKRRPGVEAGPLLTPSKVLPAPHARKEALGLGPGGVLRSVGRGSRPPGSLGSPPGRGSQPLGPHVPP